MRLLFTACFAFMCLSVQAAEMPFLHPLFNSHMVFPRDVKAPVWGWTTPGAKVTVTMEGQAVEAIADRDGKWLVNLGPFPAGGPTTLTVTGLKRVELNDILIGDVWLCSGQSNMAFGMRFVANSQEEIAKAEHPQLRLFDLPCYHPRARGCQWTPCNPETVAQGEHSFKEGGGVSAVAYFFGRDLQKNLNIPIGIVPMGSPGSPAEQWGSRKVLGRLYKEEDARIEDWFRRNDPVSLSEAWADPTLKTEDWKPILPQSEQRFKGIIWLRKEFELPKGWEGKDLALQLGTAINDRETTWINGEFLGNSTGNASNYKVDAKLLRPGRNVIALRVLHSGNVIFAGKPEGVRLALSADPAQFIPLAEDWIFKTSRTLAEMEPPLCGLHDRRSNAAEGGTLFNNFIEPLAPFAFKGIIWYQGEANVNRLPSYSKLMPEIISEWRDIFYAQPLPILMVQLPNISVRGCPDGIEWAKFRDAQSKLTSDGKDLGLVVTIDLGEADNIHPKAKQDVGGRLALKALSMVYGKSIESSGPVYEGLEKKGLALHLKFSHIAKGLVAKGDTLNGFSIAGTDKVFFPADAVIEKNVVAVSSQKVPEPTYVRYAWCDNPACNLYNSEGLPAMPFRTDKSQ